MITTTPPTPRSITLRYFGPLADAVALARLASRRLPVPAWAAYAHRGVIAP